MAVKIVFATGNQGKLREIQEIMADMDVEIIADGKHLPPDLIRLIYKIKGGDKLTVSFTLKNIGMNVNIISEKRC